MNSLNLLSARVSGTSSSEISQQPRTRSYSEGNLNILHADDPPKRSISQRATKRPASHRGSESQEGDAQNDEAEGLEDHVKIEDEIDEKKPLLGYSERIEEHLSFNSRLQQIARRLANALTTAFRWTLTALIAPGRFIAGAFYDEKNRFSFSAPIRKLSRIGFRPNKQTSLSQTRGFSRSLGGTKTSLRSRLNSTEKPYTSQKHAFTPSASSDSEQDTDEKAVSNHQTPESRPLLQSSSSSEEIPQTRRSVRIKSHAQDSTRRRRPRRDRDSTALTAGHSGDSNINDFTISAIKSPTSPAASLRVTKYSNIALPPRPLIPARQPSYSSQPPRSSRFSQKTLVIDLDETLIHSLAKGGRMSSGHMVEVKLNTAVGIGGATLGPQHPILYYVHKRPHCDDFLRRVCKWYNLVVFTASVQEYADPVIDWLEQERKYFSGRFYRQHCTFRNGAYIKDLSSVEPDLSKVMILDNSPLSYIFHEGNKSQFICPAISFAQN